MSMLSEASQTEKGNCHTISHVLCHSAVSDLQESCIPRMFSSCPWGPPARISDVAYPFSQVDLPTRESTWGLYCGDSYPLSAYVLPMSICGNLKYMK